MSSVDAGTGRPERRSSRAAEIAFSGVLALGFVWFLVHRARIDLTRPVPWPDEGSFLWQALAFRDGFTLFAPELNPERHVLWMPPGFMVLEGLVFKIVPFTLSRARCLSALFVCGAFAYLGAMVRGLRSALGLSAVMVAFLFAPIVVVVGNVARMESLVLLLTMAGFHLLWSRRTAGLAVLLVIPLVHPNGLFVLVAGAVYLALTARERLPAARLERVLFAAALLAWLGYAVYVGNHWGAFAQDIESQLRFKALISSEDGGPGARVKLPILVVPALLLVAAIALSRRLGTRIGALAALAAVLLVQTVLTAGWLYDVYGQFALLLVTIVVVETTVAMIQRSSLRGGARVAALVALSGVTGAAAWHATSSPFLRRSLDRATVDRSASGPAYLLPSDYDAVSRYLLRLADEQRVSVQLIPDGEALVFEKLRGPHLGFVQQTFYVGHFDVAILHESVWVPGYVHDLEYLNVFMMHKGAPEETVLVARDGTERIRAFYWKPEKP